MTTDRFRHDDIAEFLLLAAGEGWISDRWELDLLRNSFPQGCLVKRIKTVPVAFITTLRYRRSGWIGNLLVRPEQRRQGIGAELMKKAVEALKDAGVETIWLTASPLGKPLYEKLGFKEIDRIDRWIGENFTVTPPPGRQEISDDMVTLDATGWGDRRELLLTSLGVEGNAIKGEDAFMITRTVSGAQQIGPLAGTAPAAVTLLERYLAPAVGGERICLDIPRGNRVMGSYLERKGLTCSGATVLMYQGEMPAYKPEFIGACGSMGSMG